MDLTFLVLETCQATSDPYSISSKSTHSRQSWTNAVSNPSHVQVFFCIGRRVVYRAEVASDQSQPSHPGALSGLVDPAIVSTYHLVVGTL